MFSCVLLSSFSWSLAPNIYSNLGIFLDPSLLGSFTKFLGTFLFLVIVSAVYFCPVLSNAELMLLLTFALLSKPEKTCFYLSFFSLCTVGHLNMIYSVLCSEGALGNDEKRDLLA